MKNKKTINKSNLPVLSDRMPIANRDSISNGLFKTTFNSGDLIIDIEENDKAVSIFVDPMGFKQDDFHYNIEDGVLTISASSNSQQNTTNKDKTCKMSFSSSMAVASSVRLPHTIDFQKSYEVKHNDQYITLQFPKKSKAKIAAKKSE